MRAQRRGAGSGAAHLVTGHGREHARLEEELAPSPAGSARCCSRPATWRISPRSPALAGRDERVLLDRLSHASLIDGARLAGATLKRYAHADAAAAERLLAQAADGRERSLAPTGYSAWTAIWRRSRSWRASPRRPRMPG